MDYLPFTIYIEYIVILYLVYSTKGLSSIVTLFTFILVMDLILEVGKFLHVYAHSCTGKFYSTWSMSCKHMSGATGMPHT